MPAGTTGLLVHVAGEQWEVRFLGQGAFIAAYQSQHFVITAQVVIVIAQVNGRITIMRQLSIASSPSRPDSAYRPFRRDNAQIHASLGDRSSLRRWRAQSILLPCQLSGFNGGVGAAGYDLRIRGRVCWLSHGCPAPWDIPSSRCRGRPTPCKEHSRLERRRRCGRRTFSGFVVAFVTRQIAQSFQGIPVLIVTLEQSGSIWRASALGQSPQQTAILQSHVVIFCGQVAEPA